MPDDKSVVEQPISQRLEEDWHKAWERLIEERFTMGLEEPASPDLSELDWSWGK